MTDVVTPIIVLGGLGLGFGLALSYLSKKFQTEIDPNILKVRELLPGINCGACGYAGCDAFAEAVVNDNEDHKLCAPGKSRHAKIAKVLGRDATDTVRKVARLHCHGGRSEATRKYKYIGEETCKSAAQVTGGPISCEFGCIGFGDCVGVCPVDAIRINSNKLPEVDENICVSCGKCVTECPKGLFSLQPYEKTVYVKCNSEDSAKDVNKFCKVGCIACRLCEKNCPFDAIHVDKNIARIDYEKCTSCGICVVKCPRKIILKVDRMSPKKKK